MTCHIFFFAPLPLSLSLVLFFLFSNCGFPNFASGSDGSDLCCSRLCCPQHFYFAFVQIKHHLIMGSICCVFDGTRVLHLVRSTFCPPLTRNKHQLTTAHCERSLSLHGSPSPPDARNVVPLHIIYNVYREGDGECRSIFGTAETLLIAHP